MLASCGAVYCNRSCLWVCGRRMGRQAVSEPYYSQRARSVGIWALFHLLSYNCKKSWQFKTACKDDRDYICTNTLCPLLFCMQGFFRRSVKERDCMKYECAHGGWCTITSRTRNICKACRYNQCLRVGMEPESTLAVVLLVIFEVRIVSDWEIPLSR